MKEKLSKPLDHFIGYGLIILVFLLPLFFLPLTPDFFDFNKQALLVFGVGLLLLAWTGKMVISGEVRLTRSPFDLPLVLLALAYLASTTVNGAGRAEALALPGATTTIVSLTLLYFIITNNLPARPAGGPAGRQDLKEGWIARIFYALAASSVLLSLIAVYQFIGVGPGLVPAGVLPIPAFTPAGAALPLLFFVGLVFLSSLELGLRAKETSVKIGWFLAAAVMVVGGAITLSLIIPRQEATPILLPQAASWTIAVESLKDSPLFGVGPANFTTAFSRFRPIAFNQNPFWSLRFNSSSNFYFHLLTTVGVLGLAAYLFLIWRFGRTLTALVGGWKKSLLDLPGLAAIIPLILVFIINLFLPAAFLLLFVEFLFLGLFVAGLAEAGSSLIDEKTLRLTSLKEGIITAGTKPATNSLPWFFFVPAAALVLAAYFLGARAWWAEFQFKKALDAVVAGQGTDAYNRQISAIAANPFILRYRTSYAQTNLALANALAGQENLTDQDRATVSRLIQQAIREAKIATVLAPQNVAAWENLARVYRALINFAQGADSWAIASFQQSILFDPVNPRLRLDLGGVYYGLSNFAEAERHYRNAVALNPDLANAHYNLAVALREQGKIAEAVAEMETTQSLVEPGTADYQTATAELEALRQRLGEAAETTPAGRPETLAPPEPLPAGFQPLLELPAELRPEPAEEAAPAVSPSPSPE